VLGRTEADLGWLVDAQRFRAINALVYQDIRSASTYRVILTRKYKCDLPANFRANPQW